MIEPPDEHTLEFLLAFDGRIHHLEGGYKLKFEVKLVNPTLERPHGLKYSFTLHDPKGRRILGIDNAHSVPSRKSFGSRKTTKYDHWHRNETDFGIAYDFVSVEKLLEDFENAVNHELELRMIERTVTGESAKERRDP